MGVFGELERTLAELYAFRWAIGVGVLVMLAALTAFGYRRGWHLAVWQRRRPVAVLGAPLLVLAIVGGWYAVSPLFERTQLEEANPLAGLAGATGAIQMMDSKLIADIPAASPASEPVDSMTKDSAEMAGNPADQDSAVASRTVPMPPDSSSVRAMEKAGDATTGIGVVEETEAAPIDVVAPDTTQIDPASSGASPTDAGSASTGTTPADSAASSDPTPTDAAATPTDKAPADATPVVASRLVDRLSSEEAAGFTERELEVLRALASGGRDKEIADQLFLSFSTVRFHISNIYRKLGAQSRTEAVRVATERGLLNT